MKKISLAAAVVMALPVLAAANVDFSTKEGCMSFLARHIQGAEAKSGMTERWREMFAPARAHAPEPVDRMVEIKTEIAALQSELVDEIMKVCASYD